MKTYQYQWPPKKYLLHAQVQHETDETDGPYRLNIIREHCDGTTTIEPMEIADKNLRFIITRKRPEENSISFSYSEQLILSVYELEDTAFYPIEPYYCG